MTRLAWLPLLAALPLLSGCSLARHTMYVLFGGHERDVKAEFDKLEGKSVVVVLYCDKRVQYEYPTVTLTLASAVAEELRKNVKPSKIVDPRRVVKYQDSNVYWDEMDKTDLGKAFGAEYVLFVTLVEYSTREPGAVHLYRGRISAEPSVYQADLPERQARVWRGETLHVLYPEHDPRGLLGESDRAIRETAERLFADKLVKKFHDHKVPIE